jgi:16S rRNA (adenine1518-N6/adenine1519-N6)-dimethyltransferase
VTHPDQAAEPDGPALLGPAQIRQLAARLGVRPTKRLGQNFVIDHGTVRRIVALAGLRSSDVVLEVGPGFGSLTLPLLGAVRRVIAVEMDPVLAAALPGTVAEHAPALAARLEVVTADAARIRELPGEPPTVLVANLPYNATVPVLLNVLARLQSLRAGLVMVQAEVGARMCAPPGSREYGVSSAKLAWFAQLRPAGPVARTVFWPVPGVDSCLVSFTRTDPPPTSASREQVFAVIDAAFGQRRKTLRAALASWAGSAQEAERLVRAAGLDPGARGEALSIAEFARLAQAAVDSRAEGPAADPGRHRSGLGTGRAKRRPDAVLGLGPGERPVAEQTPAWAADRRAEGPTGRDPGRGPGERPVSRRAPARGVAGGSGGSPPRASTARGVAGGSEGVVPPGQHCAGGSGGSPAGPAQYGEP